MDKIPKELVLQHLFFKLYIRHVPYFLRFVKRVNEDLIKHRSISTASLKPNKRNLTLPSIVFHNKI